mmetsp:Transcript_29388/g.82111  ORF Transcript_29388/g.82111 Transcript_29388/m.82111 type:complete len:217 (+) Transcript_29388:278-928(+)
MVVRLHLHLPHGHTAGEFQGRKADFLVRQSDKPKHRSVQRKVGLRAINERAVQEPADPPHGLRRNVLPRHQRPVGAPPEPLVYILPASTAPCGRQGCYDVRVHLPRETHVDETVFPNVGHPPAPGPTITGRHRVQHGIHNGLTGMAFQADVYKPPRGGPSLEGGDQPPQLGHTTARRHACSIANVVEERVLPEVVDHEPVLRGAGDEQPDNMARVF